MKQYRKSTSYLIILSFFLAAGCASFRSNPKNQEIRAQVNDLVRRVPAGDPSERDQLNAEIIKLGPAAIAELCSRLLPPGLGDDSRFRTALAGLGTFVSRPGAEAERQIFVESIIGALQREPETEVRAFLIRRLQEAGRNESVEALGRFVLHEQLWEPSISALSAISTPDARETLINAIAESHGANRLAILQALAAMQSPAAATEILKITYSDNRDEKMAALHALSQIGMPTADSILARHLGSAQGKDRSEIASYYLIYAQRIEETGNKRRSAEICRQVIDEFRSDDNTIRQEALGILAATAGRESLDDLIDAIRTEDGEMIAAALVFTADIRDQIVTERLVDLLSSVPPGTRIKILDALGKRGDPSALNGIVKQTESSDKDVRIAAISAAARLGIENALPALIELMKGSDEDEIASIKSALVAFPVAEIIPLLMESFPTLSVPSRIAVLDVVSRNPDGRVHKLIREAIKMDEIAVRIAAARALEKSGNGDDFAEVLKIYLEAEDPGEQDVLGRTGAVLVQRTGDPQETLNILISDYWSSRALQERQALLGLLARVGGDSVLQILSAAAESPDDEMQDFAVRLLSGWSEKEAIDILLGVARRTKDPTRKTLALRGCIRIAGRAEVSPRSRLDIFKKTLSVAGNADERRLILAGLAQIGTRKSLSLIATLMHDQDIGYDAAVTALGMISSDEEGAGLGQVEIAEAFIDAIVDSQTVRQVDRHLETLAGLNQPPEGFEALFNGYDLTGWKGLVKNPVARAKMGPEELEAAQVEADSLMREHWRVEDGILIFDGKGHSLCTVEDYGDFEMLVDWKIEKEGDSGIYLRGSPQVQIWDPAQWPVGSGGLYNNQKGPSKPLVPADNPIGEWNTFRIKMIGDKVTVHLNDVLVVDNVVLENYWERDKPIYPVGQIELQSHNTPLYFRNIFIREIPREEPLYEGLLFNGTDLSGWESVRGQQNNWQVNDGILFTDGEGGGWLSTQREFSNFKLDLEFRVPPGGNSGVFLRAPRYGDPAYSGMEIQVLDDYAKRYSSLRPWQYTGSIYAVQPPSIRASKQANQWQKMTIICDGPKVKVVLNDVEIINSNLIEHMDKTDRNPGLKRRKGFIGLQNHSTMIEYRNIRLVELSRDE